jgi:hypothetical protein
VLSVSFVVPLVKFVEPVNNRLNNLYFLAQRPFPTGTVLKISSDIIDACDLRLPNQ